ncbi:hypothetical protein J6590_045775 [Homalodisca vitripennis]|nr:hypothetical protein J6590_045775 [Homalodisca vitripennis]
MILEAPLHGTETVEHSSLRNASSALAHCSEEKCKCLFPPKTPGDEVAECGAAGLTQRRSRAPNEVHSARDWIFIVAGEKTDCGLATEATNQAS